MTTPARNESLIATAVPKIHQLVVPPGTSTTFNGSALAVRWYSDVRPASANAPKLGGLKLCASWRHDFRSWQRLSTFDGRVARVSGPRVERRFTLGAYWATVSPPSQSLEPSTNSVNRVVAQALDKLRNQDIDLGLVLAEWKQTAELYSDVARRIALGVRRFRARHPSTWKVITRTEVGNLPRNLWCTIPSAWLELQYGWNPHLSDLHGAIRYLSKVASKRPPVVYVSSSFDDTVEVPESFTALEGTHVCQVVWKHKRDVRCFLMFQLRDAVLAELSSLGLLNVPGIVWEKMRYSFVVDWMLPIGTWLSALTASVGLDFLSGGVTRFSRTTFKGSQLVSGDPALLLGGTPQFTGSGFRMRRTCFASTPYPGLYFKNPISATHIANASALLAQSFR